MTTYIALLRAVNVGGTGKLPMAELKQLCDGAGFANARTYIASGNVVFASDQSAPQVKAALEKTLAAYAGKRVPVLVRTAAEMQAIVKAHPYADKPGNLAYVYFLDAPPPADALDEVSHQHDEELQLGEREIYAYYPSGSGRSKLRIPAVKDGTSRNSNTVSKLAVMAAE